MAKPKIEQVTRFNGLILQDQSRDQLLHLIKVVTGEKKELLKTFEGGDVPRSIQAEVADLNNGITAITKELDDRYFAENPAADAAPRASVASEV